MAISRTAMRAMAKPKGKKGKKAPSGSGSVWGAHSPSTLPCGSFRTGGEDQGLRTLQ
jgi:hypothetical protein